MKTEGFQGTLQDASKWVIILGKILLFPLWYLGEWYKLFAGWNCELLHSKYHVCDGGPYDAGNVNKVTYWNMRCTRCKKEWEGT